MAAHIVRENNIILEISNVGYLKEKWGRTLSSKIRRFINICGWFLHFYVFIRKTVWLHVIIKSYTRWNCTIVAWMSTLCSKNLQYLKFKWQQRDSNPQPLGSQTITPPLAKWLCLRLRTKWLWVRIPLLPLEKKCIIAG